MRSRINFWRYIRWLQNAFNFAIPSTRRNAFSPFLQSPSGSFGRGEHAGRATTTTALHAINVILSKVPSRWPMPLPLVSAGIISLLTVAVSMFVAYDIAIDFAFNNEVFTRDPKCQSDTYDYIVVGAGTAGMIVATRIANASKNTRVLLLEAGGQPSLLNDLPGANFLLMTHPANTWSYKSIPQRHVCQNCDDHRTVTSRGKMIGGTSEVNFMLYARGNKEDFNRWAEDASDEQWNYENVLPYFKKSEDYNGAYANEVGSDKYHGKGGLLNIATHSFMPGVKEFLAAGEELGYKIGDYNGENQEVFSKMDVTTQDGWRESVYRAFYDDDTSVKLSNLCIKKYAHVTKINFSHFKGKPKAVSVTYHRHDLTRTKRALKEIIVCAGVFESPKLLMLSGVGISTDLKSLGIPVVQDLPVGHLQDHAYALVGPFLTSPAANPNRDLTVKNLADMVLNGEGLAAAPFGFAGHAFFQSPVAQPPYPDLQAIQFSIALIPEISSIMHGFLGLRQDVMNKWLSHQKNADARLVVILLGRPKSTGHLTLRSDNPSDELVIDPNYLSHPDDREALLYGFKKVVQLYENTTALNTPLFRKPVPGCEGQVFKTDEYFKCVIKHMSGSFYHHVGTCALGKVVDSRLKVKGIDGLRVIDASVIPRTPNGNTMAAAIMIAEKGADFIIHDDDDNNIRRTS